MKELDETCYWLELIRRGELMAAEKMADLEKEADELTGMFVTILKHSKDGI